MFAFGPLSLVKSAEIGIEANGNIGSDEESPAEVRRTALAHTVVGGFKLTGLRDRRINTGIGNELSRGLEATNVADFTEYDRAEHGAKSY